MSAYTTIIPTRNTEADMATLLVALRALDPTAGVRHWPGDLTYVVKKATAWTAPQIAAAQNAVDTAPVASPPRSAQSTIDHWPLDLQAAFILVMEQMNVVRAALPVPLAPFTVQQFLDAIRAKAGTL